MTTVTAAPTAPPVSDSGSTRRRPLAQRLAIDRYSGLYVLAGLIVVFSILKPQVFPTWDNVRVVSADAAITAIVALGLTVSLASGALDVSVSGSMTWGIVFVCWLQFQHAAHPALAVALTIVACAVIGLVNGLIVVRLHVEPIITTMGTTAIVASLAFWLQGGKSIVSGIPDGFKQIARGDILGLPSTVVYLFVVAVALWYVMTLTPMGRYFYAVGGNNEAARLAGLRVDQLTIAAFVISATVAGVGGVLLASKVGSAGINQGAQYLLPAFAAAFLGSTQIKPGRFNVAGTLVAIYLVVTGTKGLQLVYPGKPWIKELFTGITLIAAVAIGVRTARRVRIVQDEPAPSPAEREA